MFPSDIAWPLRCLPAVFPSVAFGFPDLPLHRAWPSPDIVDFSAAKIHPFSMTDSNTTLFGVLTPVKALHPPFLCCKFANMKRLFYIIIGVYLLVSFTACKQRHPYNDQLVRIDSLADVNPDSADQLLKNTPLAIRQGTGGESEVLLLLRIKTDDKLYRPVTQYRDTILQLVDYFEHHRKVLPSLLGKTGFALPYLYAGRIFADLGDAPQALDYYQRALDAIPEGKWETNNATGRRLAKLRGLILSQIGEQFYFQGLYGEALNSFKEANKWAIHANDTLDIIFNYRDIAEQYKFLNENDSSLLCYQTALYLSTKSHNDNMRNDVMSQIASLYIRLAKFEEAKNYIRPALEDIDSADITSTYGIASKVYKHEGNKDSSVYCYNKLLEHGNLVGKSFAYKELAELALKENDVINAYQYLVLFKKSDDSVQSKVNAETVARMHAAYNYQKHKQKATDLELSNIKKQNTINIISLLSLTAVIAAFFFFRSLVRRQKIAELRLKELNAKLEEQSKIGNYEELKEKLAKYEKEITEISHQLEKTDKDHLSIRTELESQITKLSDEKIALEHAFRRATNRQKNQEEAVFSFSETSIYFFFAQSAKEKKVIPAEKWTEFIASAETNYFREFKNNLTNLCHISEHEYKMCLLFKSGFTKADIAKLLLIDRSAVGHAFARMYLRSTNHKGTVSDWEKILLVL